MVTGKLAGYLGNQMFRIAAIVGYAKKHNLNYYIPPQSVAPQTFPSYFPHLTTQPPQEDSCYEYQEPCFNYREIPYYPHISLDGLFQTEKYFAHCKKLISELFFTVPKTMSGTVAVCVRRGDYLNYPERHPVVTKEYLKKSMEKCIDGGHRTFIFFTNDPEWCKFEFQAMQMTHVIDILFDHTESPIEKMKGAASCEHQIMSNSTFDWWAAWLNPNPGKRIAVPDVWFGPEYLRRELPYKYDGSPTYMNTSDLIPEDWQLL